MNSSGLHNKAPSLIKTQGQWVALYMFSHATPNPPKKITTF